MKISVAAALFLIFASFIGTTSADVPPEPGFKRVSINLILEPQDDLAEYRFFLRSGGDVKEVFLKKGTSTTVAPLGGGAFYRSGVLLAFPRPMLTSYSEADNGNKLNDLQQKIYDGTIIGTELIKHSFVVELSDKEAAGVKDAVYRVERDQAAGIKAVPVSGSRDDKRNPGTTEIGLYSTEPKTPAFWMAVAGGALITFAFIFFGVRLARRSKTQGLVTGSSK